jgi:hypothetical protein
MADTPKDRYALVEIMARALADEFEDDWSIWKIEAAAILTSMESAGLVVVPVFETEATLDAAIAAESDCGDGDTWAAKLSASPYTSKHGGDHA